MRFADTEAQNRVLLEAIRLSATNGTVDISEIALRARTSSSLVQRVLSCTNSPSRGESIFLSSTQRLKLALEAARHGMIEVVAQALSWQEFEQFAEECLMENGFRSERNVKVIGDDRRWQIDVIGFRGELILAIDCKHWNTPGNPSRFKPVADHQQAATSHLLAMLQEKSVGKKSEWQALPMILTLSEPPSRFAEGAVLLCVEKLPSFLSGVTPYDENLPFLTLRPSAVENPMSQSH